MELLSQGALRTSSFVWRPSHGGFAFTVVCKATFDLRPDVSPLAPEQEPVLTADVPGGAAGAIAQASELIPFKKRPEALVTGHAHAPTGGATSLLVRLVAGEIDKPIVVTGDRYFGPDGALGEPARFSRMPLAWDRAAGGPRTDNPAGRPLGDASPSDFFGRVPAPNLWPVGLTTVRRGDPVPPVGLAPIAPSWPKRTSCIPTDAAGWDPARWCEQPLPADLDLAYFNAAPADQQRARPFGEEALFLQGLHPRHDTLSTTLAPFVPAAIVDRGSGPEPLHLRCDTLLIDSDRGLAMLVFRAHVLLDRPDRPGRVVITGPSAPQAPRAAWTVDAASLAALSPGSTPAVHAPVLPFAGPGAGLTGVAGAASTAAPVVITTAPASEISPSALNPALASAAAPGFVATGRSGNEFDAPRRAVTMPLPDTASDPSPASGLASPAAVLPFTGAPESARPRSDHPPPRTAPGAEAAPRLPVDDYPPARCGALAARLDAAQTPTDDLLRQHGLDPASWERLQAHWQERIDDELSRFGRRLLDEYDSAYVAAVEAHRGPISASEYACLSEAAERDAEADALSEHRLPEQAWPHVQRVWLRRLATDLALHEQVRAEVAALRAAG
ncbi:MAG: DUF2169 domain-containing protein [Polyangiaceae bacterium]